MHPLYSFLCILCILFPYTLHPTPYTLHPLKPLHPTPSQTPTPYTLHPTPLPLSLTQE
ncbi:hypothetical protein [Planktothricoides raciborskii]|uniref:Uncharacterized protein n=1 Tax=Planktothricoides raciborskii FACHB-1370 TaxID=2949576 RepID=A0ABR8EPJ8_9CYAN|nr:hypothetical protein [Planktothricoides raciborskii]MBD2547517.1 hypothetical protein [Planktothricoides raciborskii FACHB-1370]MBD2586000.1 hypothetical protein [Planktothricoides raciborskii FACHB-1261]